MHQYLSEFQLEVVWGSPSWTRDSPIVILGIFLRLLTSQNIANPKA
jgi:hypothetical protein